MNTDIHRAFINALLANASYVDGLLKDDTDINLSRKLETTLTKPLADYLGANFKVLTCSSPDFI